MKRLLFLVLAVVLTLPAVAKITLPNVLGEGMVLQQNASAKLWGWADKNKTVTVKTSWNGKSYATKSAADGVWEVVVATPAASYTPQTIEISDGQPLKLSDVLIGEVWICSGQSNMGMSVFGNHNQPIEGALAEIVHADKYSNRIRYANFAQQASDLPKQDGPCKWQVMSSATAGNCSAIAYFFAKQLTEVLDVPVGLVHISWGGSAIEAWMTREMLQPIAGVDFAAVSDASRPVNKRLGMLYNGMVLPVKNYTARGFIWYQGESNVGTWSIYAPMMASMVEAWRTLWGDVQMPFYYVEIAPYNYSGAQNTEAALLREAQQAALKLIPRSGMVSLMDAGDPHYIHPPKKNLAGARLGQLALAKTYDKKGFPVSGPLYSGVTFADGKAQVSFSHVTRGLFIWGNRALEGFEIAGADRKFYPAKATLVRGKKDMVEVSSPAVVEPVAVRYGFYNYPGEVNLGDTFGLPAFPFRTDNW